jgi:hypothetical protein
MNRHAAVLALVSAALFGLSTPAAKALLGNIDPSVLAGLLYCAAGLGVAVLRRAGRLWVLASSQAAEVPLQRKDVKSAIDTIDQGEGIVGAGARPSGHGELTQPATFG